MGRLIIIVPVLRRRAVNSQVLSSFGCAERAQITERNERRKRGLGESRRMAKLEDQAVHASTYVTDDANWVAFKTTECYAPHQIALAPGLRQHEIPPRWPSLL